MEENTHLLQGATLGLNKGEVDSKNPNGVENTNDDVVLPAKVCQPNSISEIEDQTVELEEELGNTHGLCTGNVVLNFTWVKSLKWCPSRAPCQTGEIKGNNDTDGGTIVRSVDGNTGEGSDDNVSDNGENSGGEGHFATTPTLNEHQGSKKSKDEREGLENPLNNELSRVISDTAIGKKVDVIVG